MIIEVDIKKLAQEAIKYSSRKEEYSSFIIQLLDDSIELWLNNDLEKAMKSCDDVIKLEPELQFPQLIKSVLFTSQKNYSASISIIDNIDEEQLSKNGNEIRLFISAINLFYTNDYRESLRYSNQFIKSNNGDNRIIYLIRGYANASLENHVDAIKDFKTALKEKWEVNGIKANLAYSYLRNKNHLKALMIYRKIAKYFPDHWKVQYNTGLSYFKFALFGKALPYLNRTEHLKPNFSGTYLTRGFIYVKRKQKELALADWTKAKNLGEEEKYKHLMTKYYSKY